MCAQFSAKRQDVPEFCIQQMMVRLMSDRIVGDQFDDWIVGPGSRLVARLATSGDACLLGG